MERRQCSSLDIAGGHFLRLCGAALALRGPPLQMKLSHHPENSVSVPEFRPML